MDAVLKLIRESLTKPNNYLEVKGSGQTVELKRNINKILEKLEKPCKSFDRKPDVAAKIDAEITELVDAYKRLTKKDPSRNKNFQNAIDELKEMIRPYVPENVTQGTATPSPPKQKSENSGQTKIGPNARSHSAKTKTKADPQTSAKSKTKDDLKLENRSEYVTNLVNGITAWINYIESKVKNDPRTLPQPKSLKDVVDDTLQTFAISFENTVRNIVKITEEYQVNNKNMKKPKDQLHADDERQTGLDLAEKKDVIPQKPEIECMDTIELQRVKIESLEKEKQTLLSRLSRVARSKLSDDNPALVDLSDPNRPNKLAERFGELYDNQWTDALEILTKGPSQEAKHDEIKHIQSLLDILNTSYKECREETKNQMKQIKELLFLKDKNSEELPIGVIKDLTEIRKMTATYGIKGIIEKIKLKIRSPTDKIDFYVEECISLCWLLVTREQALFIHVGDTTTGSVLDTERFVFYTKSGKVLEFLVWPALMLHEGGPLLRKGVLQPR